MLSYIIRRLLLIIPTLFGIMALNFIFAQMAPGGPVEQMIAKLQGHNTEATARIGGGGENASEAGMAARQDAGSNNLYRGSQGLDPAFIAELEKQFGFDKPPLERFLLMVKNYLLFDFGTSYFRDQKVVDMVASKLPVSISLGLWTTLLIYLISIPLGIAKARREGTPFDSWTSAVVVIGHAIPSFLFAVLLIVLFAGGSFVKIFPLRGLVSSNFAQMSWWQQILDYLWHIALPVASMVIGGFASLTLLTKNSFLEEIGKTYVLTAKAKGLSEKKVLYGHVFRNAMLIVVAGFPHAFIGILFSGSLLIEVIFSLDGLGLMGFEAVISRDYPVMFGTLYVFTLIGLVMNLISDVVYMLVDPRIDFEGR
ncbi:MAG: microcin C ABC transporter permease YejB [Alphaproteobacteria bacterium]